MSGLTQAYKDIGIRMCKLALFVMVRNNINVHQWGQNLILIYPCSEALWTGQKIWGRSKCTHREKYIWYIAKEKNDQIAEKWPRKTWKDIDQTVWGGF